MNTENGDNKGQSKPSWQSYISYAVAILALIGFALLIANLLGRIGSTELEWTRAIYLLTGVEAVAFAAAGFLFGREVNRKRAEKAEVRADAAEERASESDAKAAVSEQKGRDLKTAITIKASGEVGQPVGLEALSAAEQVSAAREGYQELKLQADQLFPDQ